MTKRPASRVFYSEDLPKGSSSAWRDDAIAEFKAKVAILDEDKVRLVNLEELLRRTLESKRQEAEARRQHAEELRRFVQLMEVEAAEKSRKAREAFKLKRPRIHLAPGTHILSLLRFVYSKRTYERVFGPIIGDMRDEYLEALTDGRDSKARYIVVMGHLDCLKAVVLQLPVSITKALISLWRFGS